MRGALGALAALVTLVILACPVPATAANFGAHVGLSEDTVPHPYFVAGALLADLDHFLAPGEPPTDTPAFAQGMLARAWGGSENAWWLSRRRAAPPRRPGR